MKAQNMTRNKLLHSLLACASISLVACNSGANLQPSATNAAKMQEASQDIKFWPVLIDAGLVVTGMTGMATGLLDGLVAGCGAVKPPSESTDLRDIEYGVWEKCQWPIFKQPYAGFAKSTIAAGGILGSGILNLLGALIPNPNSTSAQLEKINGKLDQIIQKIGALTALSQDTNQHLKAFTDGFYRIQLQDKIDNILNISNIPDIHHKYEVLYNSSIIGALPNKSLLPMSESKGFESNLFVLTKEMKPENIGNRKYQYTAKYLGSKAFDNISIPPSISLGKDLNTLVREFQIGLDRTDWSTLAQILSEAQNNIDLNNSDIGQRAMGLAYTRQALYNKILNTIYELYFMEVFHLEFAYNNPQLFPNNKNQDGALKLGLELPFKAELPLVLDKLHTLSKEQSQQILVNDILRARGFYFGVLGNKLASLFGGNYAMSDNKGILVDQNGNLKFEEKSIPESNIIMKNISYVSIINNKIKVNNRQVFLGPEMDLCSPDAIELSTQPPYNEIKKSNLKFSCRSNPNNTKQITIPIVYKTDGTTFSDISFMGLNYESSVNKIKVFDVSSSLFEASHNNPDNGIWDDRQVNVKIGTQVGKDIYSLGHIIEDCFLRAGGGGSWQYNGKLYGNYWGSKCRDKVGSNYPISSILELEIKPNIEVHANNGERTLKMTSEEFNKNPAILNFNTHPYGWFPWRTVPVQMYLRVKLNETDGLIFPGYSKTFTYWTGDDGL